DRIHVEADLVGVFHLPHDLGVQFGVRLRRRRLQFGVQPQFQRHYLLLSDFLIGFSLSPVFYTRTGIVRVQWCLIPSNPRSVPECDPAGKCLSPAPLPWFRSSVRWAGDRGPATPPTSSRVMSPSPRPWH